MQIDNIQNERNEQARRIALGSITDLAVESTALIQFASRGHVLVIGDMDAMDAAHRMEPPLHARVLLTEGAEEPGVPIIHQAGRALKVSGHLGAFEIELGEAGKANAESLHADLILDLSPTPVFSMPTPPLGYIHTSIDEDKLRPALDAMAEMVGTFEKPKFFHYDSGKCAHGRNGKVACTQCIDACPTDAITSLIEKIEVNPNLCQGGGVCASVCPSGAIRYAYPGAKDTLEQVRALLRSYQAEGGQQPVVAFFAETDGDFPEVMPGNVLPMMLEELASAGLEVWLTALSYGAQAIRLVDGGSLPGSVREALENQVRTANEIIAAMGFPEAAIALIDGDELMQIASIAPHALMTLAKSAAFSTQNDKRETAYMAIDHLFEQAKQSQLPVNTQAELSQGAPFGNAQVDERRCTLCMACVSACPGKALRSGQDSPMLRFVEANCLQCGMCTETCPEDAITISPRLLLEREERNQLRTLHEEQPFHCVECGKAFATKGVISNMLVKLKGHAMFQTERARRRLMMCDDCRVSDVVQDPEAMDQDRGGQFRQ